MIETYLRESANIPLEEKPKPEEIEFNITRLLIEKDQVESLFTIEVVPLDNSYILRPRNLYTSMIIWAMPMFCKECGKLLEPFHFRGKEETIPGYMPCSHQLNEHNNNSC